MVRFDGAPVEPGMAENMTAAMAGRGPDGIRHWQGVGAALGQCMLRTTPEALEETQPLANEDSSVVLVMDGRVDNREDLQRELRSRGAVLRDRSDAELVLRAYETWDDDCPRWIIGEFVFFAWDVRRRRLFAARDVGGSRLFHYHAGDGWFAFASEIDALLASGLIEPRLDEVRLLDYLVPEFTREDEVRTFYQGIKRMPAGHAMSITDRGPRAWRYWDPESLPGANFASLDDCAEGFLHVLRIAVECRLRSNGSVGAALSGGLDSSSIVGLIRAEFRDQLRQPLMTFSGIREDRENCLDWTGIQAMLAEGWLDPTIITSAVAADACRSRLDAVAGLGEPFALYEGFFDTLIYESACRRGCRVVLDGGAGDLLFYSLERTLSVRQGRLGRLPAVVAACRRHRDEAWVGTMARQLLAAAAPERAKAIYRKIRDRYATSGTGLDLLRGDVARGYAAMRRGERRHRHASSRPANDRVSQARIFTSGIQSFAYEVNGQNALSMGVEPRSPYTDRRVLEFAIRMPAEAKTYTHWFKLVMRMSMAGKLPESVRWRREREGHPLAQFYERFIQCTARSAPEIWNLAYFEQMGGEWVDAVKLRRSWGEYARRADFDSGIDLLAIAILSRWLETRFRR